jgi:hypothetical protein
MKRSIVILALVLSSLTWGTAFAKGGAKAKVAGGHSSPAARTADLANLALARSAASAKRAANGDTAAQRAAAAANLAVARADKAAREKAVK